MTRWYIGLSADYERVVEAEDLSEANAVAVEVIRTAKRVMPEGWKFDTLEITETTEVVGEVDTHDESEKD